MTLHPQSSTHRNCTHAQSKLQVHTKNSVVMTRLKAHLLPAGLEAALRSRSMLLKQLPNKPMEQLVSHREAKQHLPSLFCHARRRVPLHRLVHRFGLCGPPLHPKATCSYQAW